MNKVRIAVIGTGGISAVHLAGYAALDNVEIYALCDLDLPKAQRVADKYNVPYSRVYTDYHEMLKLKEIDAVSVCTWNAEHAPATIASLKAGKHVLCEKPMAMNAQQAMEMKAAADASGKLLMIGFVRRYGNDARVLKDFVDAGTLGEIYYGKATYLRRYGFPGGWFGDKRYSGGGPMIDLGVHVIDLSRYMMGNPKAVSVAGATFDKLGKRDYIKKTTTGDYAATTKDSQFEFSVEDLAVALIRFDNGAVLNVETSFDLNMEKGIGNIELFGTKAGVRLDPELKIFSEMNHYLVDIAPAGSTALSFDGLFEKEIAHFIECITTGIPCRSPAEDGIELMRILDAVYQSAKEGREVAIQR